MKYLVAVLDAGTGALVGVTPEEDYEGLCRTCQRVGSGRRAVVYRRSSLANEEPSRERWLGGEEFDAVPRKSRREQRRCRHENAGRAVGRRPGGWTWVCLDCGARGR